MKKHVEAGCVDQVNLAFVPLAICWCSGDGHLPRDFFLVPGSGCGAIIDAAQPGRCARCVQQCRNQRSLSRMGMANHGHIAKVRALVSLHEELLSIPINADLRCNGNSELGEAERGRLALKLRVRSGGRDTTLPWRLLLDEWTSRSSHTARERSTR